MRSKVRYFIAITILSTIAFLFFILSVGTFTFALSIIKQGTGGGVIGGFFTLIACFFSLAVSTLLAIIALPFTIISVKQSEKATYPTVLLVIQSIIIVTAVILLFVALANRK